jgi:hypothetical protein
MTISVALASIHAKMWQRLVWLQGNGISAAASDDFERFLQAPGTLRRPSLIVRCQRSDGNVSCRIVTDKHISRARLERFFVPFLTRLQDRTRGAYDFFVLVSDNLYVEPARERELVGFLERVALLRCDQRASDEASARALLIPDFSLQDPGYAAELAAVQQAAAAIDFDARSEVIKWRGRLSGPDYPTIENCREFPRYTLLMMSLQHPEVLDARLTHYTNLEGSDAALALKQQIEGLFGAPAPKLPAAGFVPYKYLASLDGAVSAWKRVPTILASGSVLLLQHQWSQFFYPALQAWEHYVPLAPDLSDLLERHAWLQAHPAEARAIADAGQRLAREVLRPEALDDYFVEVLDACCKLHCA